MILLPIHIIAIIVSLDKLYSSIPKLILGYIKALVNIDPDAKSIRDVARDQGTYDGYTYKEGTLFYNDVLYILKDYVLRS